MNNSLEKVKSISISPETTLLEALSMMDAVDRKLLMVTNENIFVSLLSIGDIQRAIIANHPFDTAIKNILRKEVEVAHVTDSRTQLERRMLQHRTEFMPVLDGDNQIQDVIFWEDVYDVRDDGHKQGLNGMPIT